MDLIARIPVPTETLASTGTTNAYIIGTDGAILVDPAGQTADLDRAVKSRNIEFILVTHTHSDHVDAVSQYAETTGATVVARRGHEHRFERATDVTPDRTVRDGSTLETADGHRVSLLATAGHAPDHVSLDVPGVATLVGDLAVESGSVLVDDESGDMRAYLTSLRRLHSRASPVLFPGHGPIIERPKPTIQRLIDHRLQREQRVLAAVEAGARTTDEIVTTAYEKDLTGVRDLAARTVRAHLDKLAVEGAVRWDGIRATPVGET